MPEGIPPPSGIPMETHQRLEEVDLVRGLQERDPKAMEVFLERYSPLLHHCISQFAGRDLERGAVHVRRLVKPAVAVQALAESELQLYGAHAALRGVLIGSGHSGAAHIRA